MELPQIKAQRGDELFNSTILNLAYLEFLFRLDSITIREPLVSTPHSIQSSSHHQCCSCDYDPLLWLIKDRFGFGQVLYCCNHQRFHRFIVDAEVI